MRKYYNKYCGKVEFIGIDCDDKEDAWRKTVEKERMIWTQLRNEKGDDDVAVKLGVSTYPTKIIIDRDGRIVKVFKGEVPEFYQTLDSLFAPRLPQTYDQEALMEYVLFHFPQDSTDSENNYFSTILRLVDKHVPDALWGERLKSHFAADMMGMVSSEDPRPYLNQYLAASHVDSLQQKVKEAYNRSVALNGRTYPGRLAPDFSFTDTKGKRMSLKSLRGKTLLIDIWGTWCVPCIEEMPFLDKWHATRSARSGTLSCRSILRHGINTSLLPRATKCSTTFIMSLVFPGLSLWVRMVTLLRPMPCALRIILLASILTK